jgi:hypothetical protein
MIEPACVICGVPLTAASASREHVIPNALGGLLTTRRATCVECNSTTGATQDKDLVTTFAPLLAVLDVVRQRGETQPFRFKDSKSGEYFVIQPGREPTKDANFSRQSIDGRSQFFVYAPTEQEAKDKVKKFTKSGTREIDISPIEKSKTQYTWTLSTQVLSPTLLSAVTRMAVYFARHLGIDVAMNSPAARFLRREGTFNNIVTPVHGEILKSEEEPLFEVCHGLFLKVLPESGLCLVYVVLFQYIEYVVCLGQYDVPPFESGYKINLISGIGAPSESAWVCSAAETRAWFNEPRMCQDRMVTRIKPLAHYIKNPRQVCEDRAILRGADAYFDALRHGKSPDEARAAALAVANNVLAPYGLMIESWNIHPKDWA